MKKSWKIWVPALFVCGTAHAQNSVTLYGVIDEGLNYTNNAGHGAALKMSSGDVLGSRFGLKGSEDLGGGLSAVFRLENGFNASNGALGQGGRMFGRQAYVGLSSAQYGTLTLGRQYDSLVDYLAPMALAGQAGDINVAAHPLNNDNVGAQYSIANAVKYESANYAGFHFGGLYGFSNNPGQFSNGRAWSVGAGYSNGPFKFAAAYDQLNNDLSAPNAGGAAAGDSLPAGVHRTFGVGANYAFGPGTVGLLWTHSKVQEFRGIASDMRFDNIEVNGTYGLTPALAVVGEYTYTFGKATSMDGASLSPRWHSATVGLDYSLSKRTDVYVAAAYQHAAGDVIANTVSIGGMLPASSTNSQVAATTGLRHRF
jgi:predicted porin